MIEALERMQAEGLDALERAQDAGALEAWRVEYLGNAGRVKGALAGLKDVPREQKPAVGARANAVKVALEEAFRARQEALGAGGSAAPAKAG